MQSQEEVAAVNDTLISLATLAAKSSPEFWRKGSNNWMFLVTTSFFVLSSVEFGVMAQHIRKHRLDKYDRVDGDDDSSSLAPEEIYQFSLQNPRKVNLWKFSTFFFQLTTIITVLLLFKKCSEKTYESGFPTEFSSSTASFAIKKSSWLAYLQDQSSQNLTHPLCNRYAFIALSYSTTEALTTHTAPNTSLIRVQKSTQHGMS